MLEIPNCVIKSSARHTQEGAEGSYTKADLVFEGDLTPAAARALGCTGALDDALPAFTVPKERLAAGGDPARPHTLELYESGGDAAVLELAGCSVHALSAKARNGYSRILVRVALGEELGRAACDFHGANPCFAGTLVAAGGPEPADGQTSLSFEEAAE